MNEPFSPLSILQRLLVLAIYILSAIVITSLQVWINKRAGDYSSDIEDYDSTDVFQHITFVDFILFLFFGFLFIRTAPTNHLYIKNKYSPIKAWAIFLSPAFAAVGLSFGLYCISNIFFGTQATDLALQAASFRVATMEFLPALLPNLSSFSLVMLMILSISIYYNAIMAIVITTWDSVRILIQERYTAMDEEFSYHLIALYLISLIILILIIDPALTILFKLFVTLRLMFLTLLKAAI